jgi:hypothetical protein
VLDDKKLSQYPVVNIRHRGCDMMFGFFYNSKQNPRVAELREFLYASNLSGVDFGLIVRKLCYLISLRCSKIPCHRVDYPFERGVHAGYSEEGHGEMVI